MFRFLPAFGAAALLAACTPQAVEPVDDGSEVSEPEPTPEPTPSWSDPPSDDIVPGDEDWAVASWTRLPEGIGAPTLDSLLGKVVVFFCFQHW